jgi:hypothetical protein
MRGNEKSCLSLLKDPKSRADVRDFLRVAEAWLKSIGQSPTHAAIKAPGLSGKPLPLGRVRRNLQEPAMEESEFASLLAMPANDERFAEPPSSAGMNSRGEATLAVDTSIRILSTAEWSEIARRIHSAFPFTYGYHYTLAYELGPWQYAAGIVHQTVAGEPVHEEELRTRWMNVRLSPERHPRDQRLRQVYPLQFISERHLHLEVGRETLKEWIEASPHHGELARLVDDVWSWSFDDPVRVLAANEALFSAGLLSAWDPALAGAMTI